MIDTRFDYPVFSEGEIITSEKLNRLAFYPRRTFLQWLKDQYTTRSFVPGSGVFGGFIVQAIHEYMEVEIYPGCGLTWNYNTQYTYTPIEAVPIVIEVPQYVIFDDPDPDPDNNRWDLIILTPKQSEDEFAQRLVRNPDGTISIKNLPGVINTDAEIHVIKGTPAYNPTVPRVPTQYYNSIVIAAVKIHGGQPYIIGQQDIYDTRIFLTDTNSSIFEYFCVFQDSGNEVSNLVEFTTNPNIRIQTSIHKQSLVGSYKASLQIPRYFGVNNFELIPVNYDQTWKICGVCNVNIFQLSNTKRFLYVNSLSSSLLDPTSPYITVDIDIDFFDSNGNRTYLLPTETCQLKVTLPRSD
jgi:hypothetical protein